MNRLGLVSCVIGGIEDVFEGEGSVAVAAAEEGDGSAATAGGASAGARGLAVRLQTLILYIRAGIELVVTSMSW